MHEIQPKHGIHIKLVCIVYDSPLHTCSSCDLKVTDLKPWLIVLTSIPGNMQEAPALSQSKP